MSNLVKNRLMYLTRIFFIFFVLFSVSGCFTSISEMLEVEKGSGADDTDDATCHYLKDIFLIPSHSDIPKVNISGGEAGHGITGWVISTISTIMNTAWREVYGVISQDDGFRKVLMACMTLVIAFFGVMIALGIVPLSAYHGFWLIIKLLLVYSLALSLPTYEFTLVYNVEMLVRYLVCIVSNIYVHGDICNGTDTLAGVNVSFQEMDRVIALFLDSRFWKVVMALLGTSSEGWVYALMMLVMFIFYVFAVAEAVKVYLVALIARSLFYGMGPIFLLFALFKQTKSLFDAWIAGIISFALQPVILFAFIGMFNTMVMGFIEAGIITPGATNDRRAVCYEVYYNLAGFIGFLNFYRLKDLEGGGTILEGSNVVFPVNLMLIATITLICWLMLGLIRWAMDFSNRISGGVMPLGRVSVPQWEAAKLYAEQPVKQAMAGVAGGVTSSIRGVTDEEGKVQRGTIGSFMTGYEAGSNQAAAGTRQAVREVTRGI